MKPKISVIVPAYNEELRIRDCISSLLAQKTKTPYEVLVADNGSTDKTGEIVKKLGVKLIHVPVKSPTIARNVGAKNAKSDLLVFVDADCIVPSNYIESIAQYMEAHPKTDVIGGPYVMVDAGPFWHWFTKDFDYPSKLMKFHELIFGCLTFASGNMAIRKPVFEAIDGFNESIEDVIKAEDVEMATRLKKAKYTVEFLSDLKVISSARRQQREWFRLVFVRTFYTYKSLLLSRLNA